jgi:hypothetical protein
MATMRAIAYAIALVFLYSTATAGEQSSYGLALKIKDIHEPGILVVDIENSSSKPIRIWQEANSWGAARWRVLTFANNRMDTFFQNPNQGFTINMPLSDELAVGAHLTRKLDINGGNWCGFGHCSSFNQHGIGGQEFKFQRGDRLVVIYDVPDSDEAHNRGVWYGVTATSSIVP